MPVLMQTLNKPDNKKKKSGDLPASFLTSPNVTGTASKNYHQKYDGKILMVVIVLFNCAASMLM